MNHVRADNTVHTALTIEGGRDIVAIRDAVRTFAKPLGYDRFVLFSATSRQDDEDVAERLYWVEGDWFGNGDMVDSDAYFRHCPVTRHLYGAREPFFWTKDIGKDGERYRITRRPSGRGIHGLQVPVFGTHGLEGAMSFGGSKIDTSPQTRLALTFVAHTSFLAARRLLEAPPPTASRQLSQREREILTWTAAGRRQADIAATLGLSVRTIENHLRRVRKRLGVTTTVQAVNVAVRNGDIER